MADIIYTYDSGGGHDYTALATWEINTDIDLGSANTRVHTYSNLANGALGNGDRVEDLAGADQGTIAGVLTEGNQVMIVMDAGETFSSERVYLVGDHSKFFDVDTGSQVGLVILDCYDSQDHDDQETLDGTSNTDATHYRKIRSASGCTIPFAGKAATGANFVYTGVGTRLLSGSEGWARFENFCVKRTGGSDVSTLYGIYLAYNHAKAINIVAYDCVNSGTQTCHAFVTIEDQTLFYNCIAYGAEGYGFQIHVATGETAGAICCTSVNNGDDGFGCTSASGVAIAFSCYAMDNTTAAFDEVNWDAPSGWNGADDTTAGLGGTAGDNYKNSVDYDPNMDVDYLLTAHCSANGAAGDRCGRNPYNDVTGITDFDDFLWDGANEDPLFPEDIEGDTRPNNHTADAVWDVGASEYIEESSSSSSSQSTSQSSSSSSQSTSVSSSSSSQSVSVSSSSSSESTSVSSSSSSESISASSSSFSCSLDPTMVYSRGDYAALPGADANLETAFTCPEYPKVAIDDNIYVQQAAADEYVLFLWKNKNDDDKSAIIVQWKGKSDRAPSLSTVFLQIYNRNTPVWENLDSNNVVGAGVEFTLSGSKTTNLSHYYDAQNWVSCRVYQQAV